MNVLLIDNDADFRKRFGSYIADKCRGVVLTVTDEKGADIKMADEAELIFADERMAPIIEKIIENGDNTKNKTVILTPADKNTGAYAGDGVKYISKFNNARDIIAMIPELHAAYSREAPLRAEGGMYVISVTGYGGGSGRTSFSVALARLNARMRAKETLVISIKRCSDIWDYFPENGESPGDLNLMLLNHISGKLESIKSMILTDNSGAYTLIRPESGMNDIVSLNYDEMDGLIDTIKNEKMFDCLIFDISCDLPPKSVLDRSDKVFLVNDCRREFCESEMMWRKRIIDGDIKNKVITVENFVRPKGRDVIFLDDDYQNYSDNNENNIEVKYRLPQDENSFFIKNGRRDISMVGPYSKALSELVKNEMPL